MIAVLLQTPKTKKKEEEEEWKSLKLEKFSKFKNLRKLYIGSWHNIGGKKYNRFEGSLKPLINLNKLEILNIDNTDITDNDEGLECLPDNLEEIHCDIRRKDAKCKNIWHELEEHSIPGKEYSCDFQAWRRKDEEKETDEKEKVEKILRRFLNHQVKLVEVLEKVEKIDKKIEKQEQSKKWGERLGYGSTISSAVVSVMSGASSVLIDDSAKNALTIASTAISGLGSISSFVGTKQNSDLANKEKFSKEELSNTLVKSGIDIWNNFLRDREELEEKRYKYKIEEKFREESSKKSFNEFLEVSEGLPKSLNPEDKQRMKKELREEFIQSFWKNHWQKNEYELGEKLRNFLDEIKKVLSSGEQKPLDSEEQGVTNAVKEAKTSLKKLQGTIKKKDLDKDLDDILNKINKIEEELKEKTGDRGLIKKTIYGAKSYLNSWFSLGLAHIENRSLKKKIEDLDKKIEDLKGGKDKNELSLKEILSLENPEKQKELQEFIENQENNQIIDLDKHFEEQEFASTSKNTSSAQLLEDKTIATGSTSQPTSLFRKRNISNSKENRPSQEIYELVDLQSKEELQNQIEIPPK